MKSLTLKWVHSTLLGDSSVCTPSGAYVLFEYCACEFVCVCACNLLNIRNKSIIFGTLQVPWSRLTWDLWFV